MRNFMIFLFLLIVAFAGYFGYYHYTMRDVKTPKYSVIEQHGDIEIRQYEPMIVAEINESGDSRTAIRSGFRALAAYIFGNNIAMTAPVAQQPQSSKIPMTAPVMSQPNGSEGKQWVISFVMPSDATMDKLPKPKNDDITLKKIPAHKAVVIRYSGRWTDEKVATNLNKLKDFVNKNNLVTVGEPTYAYYNPPWTLPFMRRNEVIFVIK